MSGFKMTGGPARGGRMAELVHATVLHETERREAALRAVMAHLGWTLADLEKDDAKRQRVVQVRRIRPLSDVEGRRIERALDLGEDPPLIVPRAETSVELDGVAVWRGWWDASRYTAEWHEEPLTEWMRKLMPAAGA